MTFQASITLGGTATAKKNLAKLGPTQITSIIRPAMTMGGEIILTLAKQYTPVDTGRLRSSGRVDEVAIGMKLVIVLGFHTDYAVYVHENLDANHPVGQAKFLERAMNEKAAVVEKLLLAELKKAVGP